MESPVIRETTEILKRLTPQNQAYFMTLVKVAETAEKNVKNAIGMKPAKLPDHINRDI